jgi:hypothetical protein
VMVSCGCKFALLRAAAKFEACFRDGLEAGDFDLGDIGGGLSEGSGADGISAISEREVNTRPSSAEDFRTLAVARLLPECFLEDSSQRDSVLDLACPSFLDLRLGGESEAPIDEARERSEDFEDEGKGLKSSEAFSTSPTEFLRADFDGGCKVSLVIGKGSTLSDG